MHQLPKISLLLSSISLLLISACTINKYKHQTKCDRVFITQKAFPFVLTNNKAVKFKANIDVLKNHLSGILIIKKTDSVTTHLVFITELGLKMFDFEWKQNEMKSVYVFNALNKPKLIKALQLNFKYMLLLDVYGKGAAHYNNNVFNNVYELKDVRHRYIIADSAKGVSSQAIFKRNKKSSLINYSYNSITETYSEIKSTQYGIIKIHIELNKIPNIND